MIEVVLKRREKLWSAAGYQYEAWLGPDLLAVSRDPEFAACRALSGQGITGKVSFSRIRGGPADMTMDIERGAKCSTHDGAKHQLRIGRRNTYWEDQDAR